MDYLENSRRKSLRHCTNDDVTLQRTKRKINSIHDWSPPTKRAKRSKENVGVDKKSPRRAANSYALKDRNGKPKKETCIDTVTEVIEDVVRGSFGKTWSPTLPKTVADVQRRRRTNSKSPLPTRVVEPPCNPLGRQENTKKRTSRLSLEDTEKTEIVPVEPPPVELEQETKTAIPETSPTVQKNRKRSKETVASPGRSPSRRGNGWSWSSEPFDGFVYLTTDKAPVLRRCYKSMQHSGGKTIKPRDCILLKSGDRKTNLSYVAKVAALWENPKNGEMMVSLLWYYRPEQTHQGRQPSDHAYEIFASRYRDVSPVACIEDKCYVLTFNEYCRYRKQVSAYEFGLQDSTIVPAMENYPRQSMLPTEVLEPDLVLFCRQVYDFKRKRLLKNPK